MRDGGILLPSMEQPAPCRVSLCGTVSSSLLCPRGNLVRSVGRRGSHVEGKGGHAGWLLVEEVQAQRGSVMWDEASWLSLLLLPASSSASPLLRDPGSQLGWGGLGLWAEPGWGLLLLGGRVAAAAFRVLICAREQAR